MVPSAGSCDVHDGSGVGVFVVGVMGCASAAAAAPSATPLGVFVAAAAVPFALPFAWPLVVGVADAHSCFAARKLLRSEFVSSRLERYAPGLRMMEGPPDTMLLRCDGARGKLACVRGVGGCC